VFCACFEIIFKLHLNRPSLQNNDQAISTNMHSSKYEITSIAPCVYTSCSIMIPICRHWRVMGMAQQVPMCMLVGWILLSVLVRGDRDVDFCPMFLYIGSPQFMLIQFRLVISAYDIINRKLFSLPKLLILPGVISRQPMLLVKIFPFIFLTDMVKGRMVAFVTDRVEQFQREARDVNSIRQKVEQFDMKNAELVSESRVGVRRVEEMQWRPHDLLLCLVLTQLRRSGSDATQYTRRRWDELTLEYQAKMAAVDLLRRTRDYFSW